MRFSINHYSNVFRINKIINLQKINPVCQNLISAKDSHWFVFACSSNVTMRFSAYTGEGKIKVADLFKRKCYLKEQRICNMLKPNFI